MKKLASFIILCLLTIVVGCAHAQTNTAPVTPLAQGLTPEQLAKVDSSIQTVVPLLPASAQKYVAAGIGLLSILAFAGRAVVGWKTGGFWGAFRGVFGGTNTLKLLLLGAMIPAMLLLTGCNTVQVVDFSKGTGLDLTLPLGYNGANVFELRMKVGQFYTATAVQPVSTNSVFVPQVAMASGTQGSVIAPGLGGVNGSNTLISASSTPASVNGGDYFEAAWGGGSGSGVSNSVSQAWSAVK